MQFDNCYVIINFTFRNSQFVIFFANSTSKSYYISHRYCLKSFDDNKIKKIVKFAKKTNHLSYKSICIFDAISKINAIQIKFTINVLKFSKNKINLLIKRIDISESSQKVEFFKNEIFATMHVSIFANLNFFANIFIFHLFFHQRSR